MARVIWEIGATTAMLRSIANGPETRNVLKQASAIAGFAMEREAKINLTRMVYSQPERGYRRTGTLRRSIHTAPPGADHSGDYEKAKHQDLGGSQSPNVVREEGDTLITEVGTWLLYAKRVHDGTGPRMTSHPYLTNAEKSQKRQIESIIVRGLEKALIQATR